MITLDKTKEPKTLPIKGVVYDYTIKYVYVSQRGYYPSDPHKANQDSYAICGSILGDDSCNLFGVFDGHGSYGDLCSYRAADDVPNNLVLALEREGGLAALDGVHMQDVYKRAFTITDESMHSDRTIDDSLSGTTAITLLQKGDKLFVANVGDSRAIIATMQNGKLKSSPLSSDQTPYRKDERERLKKCGARILTCDQIEGNDVVHENFGVELGEEIDTDGDPPRVWDATLEKPGCAFSRSIGDNVGKGVGVCADPEILEWNLTPDDKFAVIASDGVFEFITSQNVVQMLASFEDPIEAAKYVVAEAYRLWLTYDNRTDDITIIVLYFENIRPSARNVDATQARGGRPPTLTRSISISGAMSSDKLHASRPVRKVKSKAFRTDIAETFDAIAEDVLAYDFDAIVDNKTEEDTARLSKMLSTNFLFESLSPIQKERIYRVMTLREVPIGELVIREGDAGDAMYIIERGEFEVRKKDAQGVDQEVFTYTIEGSSFGELSLMYGKPRAASVVAKTAGQLWTLGRAAFRAVVMQGKQEGEGMLEVFQSIPVFKDVPIPRLHRLCLQSKELTFEKGDCVVSVANKDELSWCFGIIAKGIIRLLPQDEAKKRQLRAELSYFSTHEIGTKFSEARADSSMRIVCVPKDLYLEVLGIAGVVEMQTHAERAKMKGKRQQVGRSVFVNPENLLMKVLEGGVGETGYRFAIEYPTVLLGAFGYVGTFRDNAGERLVSLKVLAKAHCVGGVDARMLQERDLLAAFKNDPPLRLRELQEAWIPVTQGSMQNERLAYLLYRDLFVCDLGLAMASGTILTSDRSYVGACVYQGLRTMHEFGVMHRFLNPHSVYLTSKGVPKICDFRYAKRMNGAHSTTICGDPLYFAPEIISHSGYDYSVDLWMLGVLMYELYEECTPFGEADAAEEKIYKNLSAFQSNSKDFSDYSESLRFTQKSPPQLQALVCALMNPSPHKRLGYEDSKAVLGHDYFSEVGWDDLHMQSLSQSLDIQPAIDTAAVEISHLFDESKLEILLESIIFPRY